LHEGISAPCYIDIPPSATNPFRCTVSVPSILFFIFMHLLHRGLKERIKSGGWDSSEIGMKNGISWSPVHISWGRAWLWPISGKRHI
jgi:hypothetical protein